VKTTCEVSCEVVQDLLPLTKDNIASEDSRHIIIKHIEDCEACRKDFQDQKNDLVKQDNISDAKLVGYVKRRNSVVEAVVTFLVLAVLTFVAMQITIMPANHRWTADARIPSALQMDVTGIVFILIFLGLCVYGVVRRKNGILIGVSAYYIIPIIGLIFSWNDYTDKFGEEIVWNPFYSIAIDHMSRTLMYLFFYALAVIPVLLLIFNKLRSRFN
jgi:hypothetical protein